MSRIHQFYRNHINAIIITLMIHILIFTFLFFFKIGMNNKTMPTEIFVELKEEISIKPNNQEVKEKEKETEESTIEHTSKETKQASTRGTLSTNAGSNRLSSSSNKGFEEQFDRDIQQAKNLLKDVSQQLHREIPTIDNLKMPDAPKATEKDIKNKTYTGESNIEYYLTNRYHLKLPIPVYLAESGGKVKVNIVVDQEGNVIKAEPEINNSLSDQILSYAKTAALRTIFNSDSNAPREQKGYILYTFIPQN